MSLQISLISIGDELLEGLTLNTNMQYLAKTLYLNNYKLTIEKTIPDNEEIMLKELQHTLQQADVLILSGGLGPTHDDKTRSVVAKLLNCNLVLNNNVYNNLLERYQGKNIAANNQALVIDGAQVINNTIGTAPGQIVFQNNQAIILLPGVPAEFKNLTENGVIPFLNQHFPVSSNTLAKTLCFCKLSESMIKDYLHDLVDNFPNINVGVYPNFSLINIHINADAKYQTDWNKVIKLLEDKYQENFYGFDKINICSQIHNLLDESNLKLLVFEQFTGGMLCNLLNEVNDHSYYNFVEGKVLPNYTDQQMQDLIQEHKNASDLINNVMLICIYQEQHNQCLQIQIYLASNDYQHIDITEQCNLSSKGNVAKKYAVNYTLGTIYQVLADKF